MKTSSNLANTVIVLTWITLGTLLAPACPLCHFNILLTETGGTTPTITAKAAGGNFTAVGTWVQGRVPNANDVLLIPSGTTVTVNGLTPIAKTIVVRGVLRFPIVSNATLSVENLLIDGGGKLTVGDYGTAGTTNGPINAGILAKIVILSPTNAAVTDSLRMGRGIVAAPGSIIRMNSAGARTPFITLNNSSGPNTPAPNADGTQTVPTSTVPADWRVKNGTVAGDDIVIAGSYFTREWAANLAPAGDARLPNELRTLFAKTSTSITLDSKLLMAHVRAKAIAGLNVHVANLTRDIVIESANTANSATRGHVMLMTNNVQINGVAFNNLGRGVKGQIVSDPVLPADAYNPAPFSNPRGRYALHFHECGTGQTPAQVSNCVVRGTPGWGFVNHDSSVDFTDNVCFDFDGAGFVCEDGAETGTFDGNIAIGGIGNGEFSNQREIFGNRPRGDQGDMGFTGAGFWFNSPDITVTNNVAAGCKGSAFFYWCGGRFDTLAGLGPNGLPLNPGHFTFKEKNEVDAINAYRASLPAPYNTPITPRLWDFPELTGTSSEAVITDLPLRKFANNTAYACFTGLRFRFVNHPNTNIFSEIRNAEFGTNGLADQLIAGTATRGQFLVTDCLFWNNLNGIHGTYLNNGDFKNITIITNATPPTTARTSPIDLSLDKEIGGIGIDFHFNNGGNTLTNVSVENYTTGLWYFAKPDGTSPNLPTNANGTIKGISFTNCQQNQHYFYTDTATTASPTNADGYSFLQQVFATDNIPDFGQ